ncbi:MAG: hypothetical protein J6J21_05550 [Clostridia bacterium]|nr:hypothetical protein [Clostridia bacterium]
MEFSLLGEELEIRLSARDTARLGVDFSSFDYEEASSRALLWELLAAARAETGFRVPRENLVVHLYQKRDGAMTFVLRRRKEDAVVTYRFSDLDDLLCAKRDEKLSHARRLFRLGESFLVECEGECAQLTEYATCLLPHAARMLTEEAAPCDIKRFLHKEKKDANDSNGMSFLPKVPPA